MNKSGLILSAQLRNNEMQDLFCILLPPQCFSQADFLSDWPVALRHLSLPVASALPRAAIFISQMKRRNRHQFRGTQDISPMSVQGALVSLRSFGFHLLWVHIIHHPQLQILPLCVPKLVYGCISHQHISSKLTGTTSGDFISFMNCSRKESAHAFATFTITTKP